ncbi:MFS transporter [Microlunatus sp. Gsoil 973]|uniref:MFS transporter n=1 Tax=Microlunatus sp. Gsoil 973 TaxID=2672569 RepID=UPI0012B4EDA8|nr:MFS transporter [Microlunatus sp. Gsoil 973]QGN31708.1 MFS transporter [Microlunatus sp. Gsoil 973]
MSDPGSVPAPPAVRPAAGQLTVDHRWMGLFALSWFGVWIAQLTPIQLLLPAQVTDVLGLDPHAWVRNVVAFGVVSGIAGVCAAVAYPLTGALSDRTTSRLGRRRPWIIAGTVWFAVSLALLGRQVTIVGVGICWALSLIGFCMLTAALTAVISDQVPVGQRATVSGWMAAPQPIAVLVGVAVIVAIGLSRPAGYLLVAAVLLVCAVGFLARMPDEVLPGRPQLTFGAFVRGFWISPRRHPDFGWTLASRISVNIGNALTTTLLLYFLEFGLGMPSGQAESLLVVVIAIYSVASVIASLLVGRLSDRAGRRKRYVIITALLQSAAGLILIIAPDVPTVIIAAILCGLGYGAFLAVDQALATQVLPAEESRGRDLGIMNVAYAIPQALAPLAGAGLVVLAGGFWLLFVFVVVFAGAGALALVPVRQVA